MAKIKTLAQQLEELHREDGQQDVDPEDDAESEGQSASEIWSDDEAAATEHYVTVSKSKLRRPEEAVLGPQYAGARVSREALEAGDEESEEGSDGGEDVERSSPDASDAEEDEELDSASQEEQLADPDALEFEVDDDDAEINSDDALGESDDEKFKDFAFRGSGKPRHAKINGASHSRRQRATAADYMSGSEDEEAIVPAGDGSGQDGEVDEHMEEVFDETDIDEVISFDENASEPLSEGEDNEEENEEEHDDESDADEEDDLDHHNAKQFLRDDAQDEDEDADEDEVDFAPATQKSDEQTNLAKRILEEEKKGVVASITQAAKDDAEKGIAVRQQRKTFDSLLNVRIRLQKALVATNSFTLAGEEPKLSAQPYEAAEEAALKLFSTLNAMRSTLDSAIGVKTGSKRKREITNDTPTATIWASLKSSEASTSQSRHAILEKWSNKVRGSIAPTAHKVRNAAQQGVVDMLQDQLAESSRLVKRTKVPRSCAPLQAARKINEDPAIYDDADFYQLLLKELVDQRMVDSAGGKDGTVANPVAQWTAVKEAKTRKNVDTKASKGRKMRFTVMEKLQNFMPVDAAIGWERDATDRFFGSLMGLTIGLGEDATGESEDEALGAEEALMLFRS